MWLRGDREVLPENVYFEVFADKPHYMIFARLRFFYPVDRKIFFPWEPQMTVRCLQGFYGCRSLQSAVSIPAVMALLELERCAPEPFP